MSIPSLRKKWLIIKKRISQNILLIRQAFLRGSRISITNILANRQCWNDVNERWKEALLLPWKQQKGLIVWRFQLFWVLLRLKKRLSPKGKYFLSDALKTMESQNSPNQRTNRIAKNAVILYARMIVPLFSFLRLPMSTSTQRFLPYEKGTDWICLPEKHYQNLGVLSLPIIFHFFETKS